MQGRKYRFFEYEVFDGNKFPQKRNVTQHNITNINLIIEINRKLNLRT